MSKAISIIIGILIIIASILFLPKLIYILIPLGIIIAVLPFIVTYLSSVKKEKEIDKRFLEFVRELAESVKAGTPIGKSIAAVSRKEFGSLSPYINKLSNQLSFGIPLKQALKTFAADTKSKVISRAIELIIQAEVSGGDIGSALTAAVKNVAEIQKLNKERRAQVYGMMVQGYIIFLIFVAIMLFVQLKFLPLITSSVGSNVGNIWAISANAGAFKIIQNTFTWLLMVQAAFAGLVIGKLSEGSMKYGIKHSVILIIISYLLMAGSKLLL